MLKHAGLSRARQGLKPSPVAQLHRRIDAAFTMPEAPPDPVTVARLERADALRTAYGLAKDRFRRRALAGREPARVARDLTAAADALIQGMLALAIDKARPDNAAMPGRFAVLAMGKLGAREFAPASDADLICVYDAPDATSDEAPEFFSRLTQSLIELLSWSPRWPQALEVDMRLRPHGADGPVAVSLAGLLHYIGHDIWTWELQALTRLRPVAGDPQLIRDVMTGAGRAMRTRVRRHDVLRDAAEMRGLIEAEKPARSEWDTKTAPGGLIDVEFIAQALQLDHARRIRTFLPNTAQALDRLWRAGAIREPAWTTLRSAWSLYMAIRQIQCATGMTDLGAVEPALCDALPAASLDDLRVRLAEARRDVRELFTVLIAAPAGVATGPACAEFSSPALRAIA
jgi:glutamate-ammonia-ligase adenylyltransferase